MKKSLLSSLSQTTPAYIIAHAKKQKSRGRNLSATLGTIRNPRRALAAALAICSVELHEKYTDTRDFLRWSYVRRGGEILPFGMIRILSNNVTDSPKVGEGLELWSEHLLPYGNDLFTAEICDNPIGVVVRRKSDNEVVTRIRSEDVFTCHAWISQVATNGYLQTVGSLSVGRFETSQTWFESYSRDLSQAEQGRKPGHFDNSSFTRVSPSLAGTELLQFELDDGRFKIFTFDGKAIMSKTHRPLAFKLWEPFDD